MRARLTNTHHIPYLSVLGASLSLSSSLLFSWRSTDSCGPDGYTSPTNHIITSILVRRIPIVRATTTTGTALLIYILPGFTWYRSTVLGYRRRCHHHGRGCTRARRIRFRTRRDRSSTLYRISLVPARSRARRTRICSARFRERERERETLMRHHLLIRIATTTTTTIDVAIVPL